MVIGEMLKPLRYKANDPVEKGHGWVALFLTALIVICLYIIYVVLKGIWNLIVSLFKNNKDNNIKKSSINKKPVIKKSTTDGYVAESGRIYR